MVRFRPIRVPSAAVAAAAAVVALLVLSGCDRFRSPHERGVRSLAAGDYQAAVQAFTEAASEAESAGDTTLAAIAYANRCYAYDALGMHEPAVIDCTKSLDLVPDDTEVINNRGVAYLNSSLLDEAMGDFDRAIELRPDYAQAYANRGRLWLDKEDFERAMEDLDKAIELDDQLAEAYANRAFAEENLAQPDAALEDYERSLEIRPDALVLFTRGMLHYRFARFDEAYEDFRRAADLEPDSYLGYMARTQADFLENRPTSVPQESGEPTTEATAGAAEEGE